MKPWLISATLGVFCTLSVSLAAADTLKDVKARGSLNCGLSDGIPGFSEKSEAGVWRGLDVDFCRAVAAAVFADPTKVVFKPLSSADGIAALRDGTVDVLASNRAWSLLLETSLNLSFAAVTFHDGQGFMVDRKLGISSALELSGTAVCAIPGTRQERGVDAFFKSKKLPYKPVQLKQRVEAVQAYEGERCIVLTGDMSWLHALRLSLSKPDEHMVLPERISNRPLGPIVRSDDDNWFKIVRWSVLATLAAESLGVSRDNVDDLNESTNPQIRSLLGMEENLGSALGLNKDWAAQVIGAIGNYAEIFDRNLGKESRYGMSRGANALWLNGGMQFAPPVR